MSPISAAGTDQIAENDQTLDGGYSREELMALLQEGLDSGPSDKSWDDLIRELNVQHFGKDRL